jgi:hypothetical protein
VRQFVAKTPDELMEIRNFGITGLQDVRHKLQARGLHLRGDRPVP